MNRNVCSANFLEDGLQLCPNSRPLLDAKKRENECIGFAASGDPLCPPNWSGPVASSHITIANGFARFVRSRRFIPTVVLIFLAISLFIFSFVVLQCK